MGRARRPHLAGGAGGPEGAGRARRRSVALAVLLGAALLLLSQFTTLYEVHIATTVVPVRSVGAGANHDYALVPVAALAAVLGVAITRPGGRQALTAVGALGVVALLIALLNDLPAARASGLLGSARTGYVPARSRPGAGLYLETGGAVLLIASCGVGLLIPPAFEDRRRGREQKGLA